MEIALVVLVVVLAAVLAVVVLRGRQGGGSSAALEVELKVRGEQLEATISERDAARTELASVRGEREDALRELERVRADHRARQEELDKAREQLDIQFKGIADQVTKANSEAFLMQAKEQFENQRKLSASDLEKRQQAIQELVKPVRENLERFEKQVGEIEKNRVGAYQSLVTQVGQLRGVTTSLSEALRSPQMRGQWGEQQLHNILELSGLSERIDFFEQDTVSLPETGRKGRPDAVVHIPGGLKVVIDAKTPLSSYLDAHNADDEQRQAELLRSHATTLMGHAQTLGDRDYAAAVAGSPDFVVMFLPADPILDAAMDQKPTLWEDAWRKHRVLIATPGLLLAFLRTVAVAWQQQDLQENAQRIAEGAGLLYDSLRVYAGHVDKVGRGLNSAVNAYNDSIGSLEGRVLPRARKFEDLGVEIGTKPIDMLAPLEALPRTASAAEMVEAEAGSSMEELLDVPDPGGDER
ncbi:DNA recombination protein RmuC [Candidatus Poriferisocius sp.]|uniref:DNA recombination protein RmuC n=1 Tax=Candidatus Poriferisocius sp. TaxID=3101276 RepID=UPI003B017824